MNRLMFYMDIISGINFYRISELPKRRTLHILVLYTNLNYRF